MKAEVGRVDIVFANAGYAAAAPLGNITEEHVDGLLNTNVKGVIWTVQKAVPLMGPGGSIILSSSIVGSKGFGNWSIYSATKAAVDAITKSLAKELGAKKIRVNSINPGMIETEGVHAAGIIESDFRKQVEAQTPLGRIGQPNDVASVATFLAAADSAWITGETFLVAGGFR